MMASVNLPALYERGLSLPEIERETGIPRSTVRHRLLAAGVVLRSRAAGVRGSGNLGSGFRGKHRVFSAQHRRAISESRTAWSDAHAKGVSQKATGYRQITRGANKHRAEHVVIMEQRLGRRLRPDEVVHHIDEDRSNNSPDNLALMTRAGHQRHHMRERRLLKGQSK